MTMSLKMLALGATLAFAGATFAAAPPTDTPAAPAKAKARTPQQQRMADCSRQSKGKKGDERKAFMSSCLKNKAPAKAAAG